MFGRDTDPSVGKATQIKPGVGLPGAGRPRKLPPLNELMDEIMGEVQDEKSAMAIVFMAMRKKAAKGDTRAAELLIKYAYGQAPQKTDLSVSFVDPSRTTEEVRAIAEKYGLLQK